MEAAAALATAAILIWVFAAAWKWNSWRTARLGKARQQLTDEAEATPQEGEEAPQPLDSRLDIGDPAREPAPHQVGDGPSPSSRMSRRDMFAAGFYGGLGFLAATAVVWVALIAVAVALVLALAGDNR